MNKLMMVVGAVALVGSMAGCMSAKEKIAAEYERLTTMPPPERVVCGCDKAIDDLAGAVCDARFLAQKNLTAYANASANHREYVGFMNDVAVLVKENGMTEEDAVKQVMSEIQSADTNLGAEEKVWPRVAEGIVAVQALKPEVLLKEFAIATLRNADLIASASKLSGSFSGFDATTIAKARAAASVAEQAAETAECLAFLTEQYRRVLVAANYNK